MTKVFIGGSRRVSRLNEEIAGRLDNIIGKRFPVVIGDANGADKAVQEYLRSKHYDLVEVFCAGNRCRNNLGQWAVRSISVNGKRRDFNFYATKDRAMADEASYGLMIWDGESLGTVMNVARLVRRRKGVAIYAVPEKQFSDLTSVADWNRFLARRPASLRERIEHELALEELAQNYRRAQRMGLNMPLEEPVRPASHEPKRTSALSSAE